MRGDVRSPLVLRPVCAIGDPSATAVDHLKMVQFRVSLLASYLFHFGRAARLVGRLLSDIVSKLKVDILLVVQ